MAGAGFKDFAVGEILTASDVDTYLMQQSVMRFADAAARGSALGTAVGAGTALAEGMVSYLDDVNYMQVFDGTRWRDGGVGIGSNVVQTVKTDTFVGTAGAFQTITGLTATITPTTNTSKVLIIAQVTYGVTDSHLPQFRLSGGNSTTFVGDAASTRTRAVFGGRDESTERQYQTEIGTIVYLDSPATTSATTYEVQVRDGFGSAYINRSVTDDDNAQRVRGASSITLIEVSA